MSTRTSRVQESREAEDVHQQYVDSWSSPSLLSTDNIPARQGYVQRWIRTKLKNDDDQNNVFRKINQGWKPRELSSVPKGQYVPKIDFDGSEVIGIHGMILMERPVEIHEKHAAHNRKMTQAQLSAVKNDMHKVHEPGHGLTNPQYTNKSNVTHGRIAQVADD